MNTYVIIGVSCLCLAFILIIVNLVYTKKRNNLGENLRQAGKRYLTFYISLYRRFSRIPILKKLLLNIRKRLEIYTVSDESNIRKTTVILLLLSAAAYISIVIVFWILTRDLLILILFAILLSFIGDTIIELFISNLRTSCSGSRLNIWSF